VRDLTGREPAPVRAVLEAARADRGDLPVAAVDDGAA
jgi:hypothetical protein